MACTFCRPRLEFHTATERTKRAFITTTLMANPTGCAKHRQAHLSRSTMVTLAKASISCFAVPPHCPGRRWIGGGKSGDSTARMTLGFTTLIATSRKRIMTPLKSCHQIYCSWPKTSTAITPTIELLISRNSRSCSGMNSAKICQREQRFSLSLWINDDEA